jgi:hypothetical protein
MVHEDALLPLYLPLTQSSQLEPADAFLPAPQSLHDVAPAELIDPSSQSSHAVRAPFSFFPAAQLLQLLDEAPLIFPCPQVVHDPAPAEL